MIDESTCEAILDGFVVLGCGGVRVGIGTRGIVLYLVFPSSVNADGTLTQKGRDLAGNLTTAAMVKASTEGMAGVLGGAAAARRRTASVGGGLLPSPEQVECGEGDYGELG